MILALHQHNVVPDWGDYVEFAGVEGGDALAVGVPWGHVAQDRIVEVALVRLAGGVVVLQDF